MAAGPWDPRTVTPGRSHFLAADADRERVIEILKTAFVHGALTKDELAVRTGHALSARTYGQLAALTADLDPATRAPTGARPPAAIGPVPDPERRRLTKKVLALGACALVLGPALGAAFFTFYGGFLIMFVFTFLGTVLTSKSPAPRRPGPAPMSGRR